MAPRKLKLCESNFFESEFDLVKTFLVTISGNHKRQMPFSYSEKMRWGRGWCFPVHCTKNEAFH